MRNILFGDISYLTISEGYWAKVMVTDSSLICKAIAVFVRVYI